MFLKNAGKLLRSDTWPGLNLADPSPISRFFTEFVFANLSQRPVFTMGKVPSGPFLGVGTGKHLPPYRIKPQSLNNQSLHPGSQ